MLVFQNTKQEQLILHLASTDTKSALLTTLLGQQLEIPMYFITLTRGKVNFITKEKLSI